jgi:hypothetical protein
MRASAAVAILYFVATATAAPTPEAKPLVSKPNLGVTAVSTFHQYIANIAMGAAVTFFMTTIGLPS